MPLLNTLPTCKVSVITGSLIKIEMVKKESEPIDGEERIKPKEELTVRLWVKEEL